MRRHCEYRLAKSAIAPATASTKVAATVAIVAVVKAVCGLGSTTGSISCSQCWRLYVVLNNNEDDGHSSLLPYKITRTSK